MGLAPFFGKAALGLFQQLNAVDYDGLRAVLEKTPVALRVAKEAAYSPSGRSAALLSANLLARLYPAISIDCVGDLGTELQALVNRINPEIETPRKRPVVELVIGSVPPKADTTISISSCRWTIFLASDGSVPPLWDEDPNTLGGAFAACLGVGAVFRRVFVDFGTDPTVSSRTLSLVDWGSVPNPNPPWQPLAIRHTHLVGVGAVGNAAIWAFQHLPLSGQLNLVDGDQIALSNIQRYVLADPTHVGWPKVELADKDFSSGDLHIVKHPMPVEQLVVDSHFDGFDRLLVCVDTAATRIALQTTLPRVIWNAWTGTDDVGVSVHHAFGSNEPCLACLYGGRIEAESQLSRLSCTLGFDAKETLGLLASGAGLTADQIERIARHYNVGPAHLAEWVGAPVLKFREEAICGGLMTTLSNWSGRSEELLVPLAHQSAMAGILVATEYVKSLMNYDHDDRNIIRFPAVKPVPEVVAFRQGREAGARCFCTDPDFVDRWNAKWIDCS